MKKSKISKNWLLKQKKDPFFKKSKIQGYRSRSAYKLIEMNQKFKFLKKNSSLLDLGSFPGGWSQVAKKEIIKGKILAVDIKPMEKISNIDFIQGDFCDEDTSKKMRWIFALNQDPDLMEAFRILMKAKALMNAKVLSPPGVGFEPDPAPLNKEAKSIRRTMRAMPKGQAKAKGR